MIKCSSIRVGILSAENQLIYEISGKSYIMTGTFYLPNMCYLIRGLKGQYQSPSIAH